MSIARIFGLSPINRTAGLVTSQRRVSQEDAPMGKDELLAMLALMQRKSRLLKRVLSINTKSQHVNATQRFKNGSISKFRDSRALDEYVRLGAQMQVFLRCVAEINALEKNGGKKIDPAQKAQNKLLSQREEFARAAEGVERQTMKRVLLRDGYQCLACLLPRAPGQRLLATHITPPGHGGASTDDNLQTICLACWEVANEEEVAA